ncbi:hypothetical protein QUF50_04275, partial [Thiotrichales bacterium HSG1]|nr:hypothetical protein [Thiotrichales bacterium HSG1]
TELENVIIGEHVTFEKDIKFSFNVKFAGSEPPCKVKIGNQKFSCSIITGDKSSGKRINTRHPNGVRLPYQETYYLDLSVFIDEPVLVMAVHNDKSAYVQNGDNWEDRGKIDDFQSIKNILTNEIIELQPTEGTELRIYANRLLNQVGNNLGDFKIYLGLSENNIIDDDPIHLFFGNSRVFNNLTNEKNNTNITSFFSHSINGNTKNNFKFKTSDSLNIKFHIDVDSRHIGKLADIYMVADYQDKLYFYKENYWRQWDGEFDSLQTFYSKVLTKTTDIPVHNTNLIDGIVKIYVGYSLDNSEEIFYGVEPIRFTVEED